MDERWGGGLREGRERLAEIVRAYLTPSAQAFRPTDAVQLWRIAVSLSLDNTIETQACTSRNCLKGL